MVNCAKDLSRCLFSVCRLISSTVTTCTLYKYDGSGNFDGKSLPIVVVVLLPFFGVFGNLYEKINNTRLNIVSFLDFQLRHQSNDES